MKLILVHGRAQEGYEADALKQEWLSAFKKGLEKSDLTFPEHVTVELPYYGKLLKRLVDEAKQPQVTSETTATRGGLSGLNDLEETEFYERFLGDIAKNTIQTRDEKMELQDIQTNTRGVLNNEKVHRLLTFLDRKKVFGDVILKSFTRDVFMYLTVKHIYEEINSVIAKSFSDEECVVVGHSLGSIISYVVLRNHPHFKVKKYITVGSPLGLASVRMHLATPLTMPDCVLQKEWFNAYDDRDFVALLPLDKENFNIQPPIINKKDVDNHTDNRHGISGYLDDVVVAKAIYDALK